MTSYRMRILGDFHVWDPLQSSLCVTCSGDANGSDRPPSKNVATDSTRNAAGRCANEKPSQPTNPTSRIVEAVQKQHLGLDNQFSRCPPMMRVQSIVRRTCVNYAVKWRWFDVKQWPQLILMWTGCELFCKYRTALPLEVKSVLNTFGGPSGVGGPKGTGSDPAG